MTRVLLAIDYRPAQGGSFVPAIHRLALTLRRSGCEPIVVAPAVPYRQPWAERLARANVEVLRTRAYADLVRIVALRSPDIVHAHFSGYMIPAAIASLTRRTRVVWHVHSALQAGVSRTKRLMRVAKFRLLSRRVHAILTVSAPLQTDVIGLGSPSGRVHVVANAVDTEYFRPPAQRERSEARHALGIGDGEAVVLFFGRDAHVKGADVLARALERSKGRITLLCAAAADEVVGLMPKGVRVISPGIVADTRPLYWAADVLAMPSRYEGTPLALLEARATGLPALLSPIATFASFARTDPGACVADVDDPVAFADALQQPRRPQPLEADARERIALDTWCATVIRRYALPAG